MNLFWTRKAPPFFRPASATACPKTPTEGTPFDRALNRWLGRSQTVSKIVWNLAATVLAIGLVAAALGLIDWSPAYMALLPERAHEMIRVLRRAAP